MAVFNCPGGIYWADSPTAGRIRAAGDYNVWTIDGAAANSRESFFAALAAELKFPGYFGYNWDATYDCLTDLAGGNESAAVLAVTHGDQFLAGMGREWETAHRVFADAVAFWQGRGRLLLIYLVGETSLLGIPDLPLACLDQEQDDVDADRQITEADARIRELNRAGKFEEALRTAHELVVRFPDNPGAHFVLGGTFDFQDREAEAVPPYLRAWELGLSGEDVPRFYVQYGSTLRNVGQLEESVRVLQEGRERFPHDAAIQAFLALALSSAGRETEALAMALSALVQHADAVDLHGYERALSEYIAELQPSSATT